MKIKAENCYPRVTSTEKACDMLRYGGNSGKGSTGRATKTRKWMANKSWWNPPKKERKKER